MPKLDPNSDDFRASGHRLIDWIADYLDGVDRYDVLSRVKPGEVAAQFPKTPSRMMWIRVPVRRAANPLIY